MAIPVAEFPPTVRDPFWQQYESNFELFAKTEFAQPGIDAEVASVLLLAGCFIWPVWARAHSRSTEERRRMAERFGKEIIRLCLHGTLRPEKYPEIDAALRKESTGTNAKARRRRFKAPEIVELSSQ